MGRRMDVGMTEGGPVREDKLGASTFLDRGWSLIAQGDYPLAEESLRKAIALSPRDPQGSALLAWSLMHQNMLDEASASVSEALKLQPSNSLAHVAAGYVALRRGNLVEAIRFLTRASKMDNDPKAKLYANLYLGITYLKREMHQDAGIFLRQAVSLGPNLTEGYYYLGRALYRSGLPEEAKGCWRVGAGASKRNAWGVKCQEILSAVESGQPFPHPL